MELRLKEIEDEVILQLHTMSDAMHKWQAAANAPSQADDLVSEIESASPPA